jgi:TolB-like protein/DNA-binding winged helix-turn-helix (wHTH) protein
MKESREPAYLLRFGVFEVDRQSRELRKQGRRVRLQDQPFQLLCMVLDRAGAVVTREDLRQALWPGSVYVDFDHGLNNAIARLREALGDNAASPQYIETLPRLGYRFIYPVQSPPPVQIAPPAPDTQAGSEDPGVPKQTTRRRSVALVGGAVALAALAIGLWLGFRESAITRPGDPGSDEPSVAVLPFASLSADADDEYFADGLSDELLNQLARIRGLRVPGRTSSFQFKGRQTSPAEIAKTLKVTYLLEGSVRRSGERVRITAQLTDARNGYPLWSETFERDFEDIFSIEDEIALSVVSALQVQLLEADEKQLRRRGTHDAEAYRLYLMGMSQLRGRSVRMNLEGARNKFEQAIALDPGFAAAHAGLASYHFTLTTVISEAPEENRQLGRAAAERAFALDPEGGESLRVMANFEMLQYRFRDEFEAYARAEALFRRAIEFEPTNSFAHFDYARAIQWYEPKLALQLFDRAAELDPQMPLVIGMAALTMSRLGMHDAARLRMQDLVARSGVGHSSRHVSAFESYLGRLDLATAALENPNAQSLEAGSVLTLWGLYMSLGDRSAVDGALREAADDPLIQALRRAILDLTAGRREEAFALLDREREGYPLTRLLDLPAARLALIAGKNERARAILEQRLPDLARGSGPINAPRVLPALDLVLAWSKTGHSDDARRLLDQVEAYLDGPDAPRLPLFTVQRAKAHLLAGRSHLAWQSLDRAYTEGFRMTCVLDLHPQPLFYFDCIDVDPVFSAARRNGQFDKWLARIQSDNRGQLERLRSHPGTDAAS